MNRLSFATLALIAVLGSSLLQAEELATIWSDDEDFAYRQDEFALRGFGDGRRWISAVRTEVNPHQMPRGFEDHIAYGNWIWSERTGKPISHVGNTTSEGYGTSGKITVKFIDSMEMYALRGDFFVYGVAQVWYYQSSREITGAIIYINVSMVADSAERMQLVYNHELGHSLGVRHGSNPLSVMYTHPNGSYALSYDDVHRAEYEDHMCFVELTREFDLYIPSAGGMSALLEFDGVDQWEMTQYEYSDATCSTVSMDEERKLTFTDVRTLGMSLSLVEMVHVEGDIWRLWYAE